MTALEASGVTERLLTARELADLLGLSAGTVLDKWERGELPGFRLGARVGAPVRFRWSEVEARLEEWRAGGASTPRLAAVSEEA